MLQPPTALDYLLTSLTVAAPFLLLFAGLWRLRGRDDLRNRAVTLFGIAMLVPVAAIVVTPVLLVAFGLLLRALSISSATLNALPHSLFWQGALFGIVAVALRRKPARRPTDAAWLCAAAALGATGMGLALGIARSGANWPLAFTNFAGVHVIALVTATALIMGYAFVLRLAGRIRRWVWLAWLVPAAYDPLVRFGVWDAIAALHDTRFWQLNRPSGVDWEEPLTKALPLLGCVAVVLFVLPRLRKIARKAAETPPTGHRSNPAKSL